MTSLIKFLFPQFFNQLLFRWQLLKYAGVNRRFKQQHPGLVLPDAYTLYESYQLNYRKYIEDGELTANEILVSVKDHLPANPSVLDWGCGPARITRHLKKFNPDAIVTGSDTNRNTIAWNNQNIKGVDFVLQNHEPSLPFSNEQFNLVIGFSVLTHIPISSQQDWLNELHRILQPGGIVWFTTHGNHFIQKLSDEIQKKLTEKGMYSTDYPVTGHRMMTTYHQPEFLKQLLEEKFELLAHFDGAAYPEKAGWQDLWIIRRNGRCKISDVECRMSDVGYKQEGGTVLFKKLCVTLCLTLWDSVVLLLSIFLTTE